MDDLDTPQPIDEARVVRALALLERHDADGDRVKWCRVLTQLFVLGWHMDDRVRDAVRHRADWYDQDYAEVVGLTATAMRLWPDSTLVDVVFL